MNYHRFTDRENGVRLEVAEFDNGIDVREYHLIAHSTDPERSFGEQLRGLTQSFRKMTEKRFPAARTVFRRYFVSDAANQQLQVEAEARATDSDGIISVIGQPPLNGTKIAMWAYMQTGADIHSPGTGTATIDRNGYRHVWSALEPDGREDSHCQTKRIFEKYIGMLAESGLDLPQHCIRTWLLVNDIDNNYAGVVRARNEVFDTVGLTPDTHFIASTGIAGRDASPQVAVRMDAYAVKGLVPAQVRHLHAPTHMNPTHEYGVRFERGTSVSYGDRSHVYISGTASIDNKGNILWAGDIRRQTLRMWENVETLLAEADCTFADLAQIIVYLRDPADYTVVRAMFDEKFPDTPAVMVHAPVCRPGWLIEMECIAIKPDNDSARAPF